jgi:hypothetical protein
VSNGDVRVYIITFGVSGVNLAALNQYLYDSADIIAFWNYVPLVYCVKSRATATHLSAKLAPFFPNGTYMVAEINRYNLNGVLPKPAWDWFYLEHHEKHQPPALTAGLGFAGSGLGIQSPFTSPLGLGGVLGLWGGPPSDKK